MQRTVIFQLIFMLMPVITGTAQEKYPAGSMEYPVRAVTHRASSYDRNMEENFDARIIRAGETKVLADLRGPGRITHIWMTSLGYERGYLRSAVIRMYWDGQKEPSVEVPLGDFFAAGHGMMADVNSSRVATSSYGRAKNCYWSMPFRKSALVTLTNESPTDSLGLYWYVEWEERGVPEDVPYFHAQYSQEYPVKPGEDYLIADIKGKGHYVGTVLSVRASQPGWFGEGDDMFYIDGDRKPTLHGTGTEDYFNDAWGFRVVNRPNYGVSIWEGYNTGSRITAYRWHVTDPVFFNKSLKFTIEHKGNYFNEKDSLLNSYSDKRPDLYSSVAIWYQTGKAKRFAELPPAKERMAPFELVQPDEQLKDDLPENARIVDAVVFTNHKAVKFVFHDPGDSLVLSFKVGKSGFFVIYARLSPAANSGIYDFYLDNDLVREEEDLGVELHQVTDIKLGDSHHLDKGGHKIRIVFNSAENHSDQGAFIIDALVVEPIIKNIPEQ